MSARDLQHLTVRFLPTHPQIISSMVSNTTQGISTAEQSAAHAAAQIQGLVRRAPGLGFDGFKAVYQKSLGFHPTPPSSPSISPNPSIQDPTYPTSTRGVDVNVGVTIGVSVAVPVAVLLFASMMLMGWRHRVRGRPAGRTQSAPGVGPATTLVITDVQVGYVLMN